MRPPRGYSFGPIKSNRRKIVSFDSLSSFADSSLRNNADMFDEKNRAFTICAYACHAEAWCGGQRGC